MSILRMYMGFKPIDTGIICAIYYEREQQANEKRRNKL